MQLVHASPVGGLRPPLESERKREAVYLLHPRCSAFGPCDVASSFIYIGKRVKMISGIVGIFFLGCLPGSTSHIRQTCVSLRRFCIDEPASLANFLAFNFFLAQKQPNVVGGNTHQLGSFRHSQPLVF